MNGIDMTKKKQVLVRLNEAEYAFLLKKQASISLQLQSQSIEKHMSESETMRTIYNEYRSFTNNK